MAISYYLTTRQPDLYQATATLMVGTAIQNANPNPQVMNLSDTLAQAYAQLVRRRPITSAVLTKLGVQMSPEDLARLITTRVSGEAQLLEISITVFDPQWAAEIANGLAEELVRQSPGSNTDTAQLEFTRAQMADLQAKIAKVSADVNEQRKALANMTSAAEIADTEDRITALERVLVSYQSVYATLLQSVMSDQRANILSIVEPAYPPSHPVPRNDVMVVSLAGLAGLGLAFGGVLLIEYLDDRTRWEGPGQESVLGLPVLGAIRRMSVNDDPVVLRARPSSREAEAIRGLRTGILLSIAKRPCKVLLMSSPSPREGKSLVGVNLAAAMAALGRRTLLVDADLRKRDLHKLLGIPKGQGIVELLDGSDDDLSACIQQTSLKNLSFLRAGGPSADPTSLLSSAAFEDLLGTLTERFDLVLLDSPAALAVPDAEILATLADGVLLLVDAETTSGRMAMRAKNALVKREGGILGVIFNRVQGGHGDYYHYYH